MLAATLKVLEDSSIVILQWLFKEREREAEKATQYATDNRLHEYNTTMLKKLVSR